MKALFNTGLVLLALTGCGTAPHWESRFGQAVREARLAQTLDPEAGLSEAPLPLTDGKSIAGSLGKYNASYGHGMRSLQQQEVNANAAGSAAAAR